jgi:sortase A
MRVRLSSGEWLVEACRGAALLLVAAGAVAVSLAVWARADAEWYQQSQSAQFDGIEPVELPEPAMLPAPALPGAAMRSPRREPWRDPAAIGRLEIPRLDVRVVIREGIGEATLRRAVGHVPGTALPGEIGNFVVAGHRDTYFRPLRAIEEGDEVVVRTAREVFRYEVTSLMVVAPDHSSVLREGSEAVCTLVTCFPFDYVGAAPRRWIVRARLVARD